MKRVPPKPRYIPNPRGGGRIIVEHRDFEKAVVGESYVVVPRSPTSSCGRLAREVAHMLRGEPLKFPEDLRSDA